MIISAESLGIFFDSVSMAFNKALSSAPSCHKTVSMVVPSTGREEVYGWLGGFPRLREWIGDRVIKQLASNTYAVVNREFETTVSVKRNDLEDDRFGIYASMFEFLAKNTAVFPDEIVFALLSSGFFTNCYDGLPFFSTAHPVGRAYAGEPTAAVSNVLFAESMSGVAAGPAWYLLDCSQPIRPLVWQERRPFVLTQRRNLEDPAVFDRGEFLFGVDGRANAGFGLWQLASATNAPLNAANYQTLRAAMMEQYDDEGRPLGIVPTHLVCPPALEAAARALLLGEISQATSNPWKNTAQPIVTQFVGSAVVNRPS